MIEVEVKIEIADLEQMEAQIQGLSFQLQAKYKECDTYYTSDFYNFREKDEALRIREVTDLMNENSFSVITYKGKKLDQISMSRQELETEVTDGAALKNILSIVGFEAVIPVEKVRREYKKEDITVCLDEVTGLGSFMEVEILVEKEADYKAALGRIESLLAGLGLAMKESITVSYLSMLEGKNRTR